MTTLQKKRKICFPIMSKIHYARQKRLLELLRDDSRFDLQLVVGGSVMLERYGHQFLPAIIREGFTIHDTLFTTIDGGNHIAMAKTAGLTALEFTNSLAKLDPDIVLIRGDRFEQLAIAMAAAYLNKTVAHIEGGDVSGTIDERVRHAITKLADIHFVTNDAARRRVVQMGEDPTRVFLVGSPDVEFAAEADVPIDNSVLEATGTGRNINIAKPFVTVIFHPVTTEGRNREHTEMLLEAVDALDMQAVWFWPNSDAGTGEIAKAIRVYRETGKLRNDQVKFVTDILPEEFTALLRRTACLVGNSSAGIKEGSYLGVPVVNIGTRQGNRLRAANVCDVAYDRAAIEEAMRAQIAHGRYPASDLYFKTGTSKRMVDILGSVPLGMEKRFYDA